MHVNGNNNKVRIKLFAVFFDVGAVVRSFFGFGAAFVFVRQTGDVNIVLYSAAAAAAAAAAAWKTPSSSSSDKKLLESKFMAFLWMGRTIGLADIEWLPFTTVQDSWFVMASQ